MALSWGGAIVFSSRFHLSIQTVSGDSLWVRVGETFPRKRLSQHIVKSIKTWLGIGLCRCGMSAHFCHTRTHPRARTQTHRHTHTHIHIHIHTHTYVPCKSLILSARCPRRTSLCRSPSIRRGIQSPRCDSKASNNLAASCRPMLSCLATTRSC